MPPMAFNPEVELGIAEPLAGKIHIQTDGKTLLSPRAEEDVLKQPTGGWYYRAGYLGWFCQRVGGKGQLRGGYRSGRADQKPAAGNQHLGQPLQGVGHHSRG